MTEQLSRERLHTIIRMVVSARGPKVADEIADHIIALEAENAEWKASFDLYNKAIRRGDDAWRQAHPDMDCYPDTGEMVKWLCDRNDALEAENERLRATLAAKETVQRANEDEMSADNERLRVVVEAARTVDKHLNSDAIFEEMREVWGNTNTSIWRDVLLRLGSALAALDEEEVGE